MGAIERALSATKMHYHRRPILYGTAATLNTHYLRAGDTDFSIAFKFPAL